MLCQELAELLGPNSTNLSILYTEAFKIIDLYILKKIYIYFCCCYRTGEPARDSPSLKCREVSFLVPSVHPWLARGRRSRLAWEGVSFTLRQPAGAPGHGTEAGDWVGVWSIPMGVGLGLAEGGTGHGCLTRAGGSGCHVA